MSVKALIRKVESLAESMNVELGIDRWGAELDAPKGFTLNATDLHCATLGYIGGENSAELWREILVELEAGLSPCECADCLA